MEIQEIQTKKFKFKPGQTYTLQYQPGNNLQFMPANEKPITICVGLNDQLIFKHFKGKLEINTLTTPQENLDRLTFYNTATQQEIMNYEAYRALERNLEKDPALAQAIESWAITEE